MARVIVHVPGPLRELTEGRSSFVVEATTVRGVLAGLRSAEPLLAGRLFADDGELRGFVQLFLDGRDVRALDTDRQEIQADAELAIVPSVAGGEPGRSDGDATARSDLTPEEALRYHRQIILPRIGTEGQERLKRARILLVGAGGLGSPAALYLAAAGVGCLGVVDGDLVELSNLQRQILHDTPSVGRRKTESARERLARVNPDVKVSDYPVRLDSTNALEILGGWDLVVDGSDNFPTRYLVNDACVLLGIPFVYGAVFRFEGHVSVFGHASGPCYRCLFRDPPPPELVPSCAEAGVLGVLPGLVGTIQATEAAKLALGVGELLVGRLLLIDSLGMQFREVQVRRDPKCVVCGENPSITALIDYEEFCGGEGSAGIAFSERPDVPEIGVDELSSRLGEGRPVQILDVREGHEWLISNLGRQGARLVPLGRLHDHLAEFDPSREVVVYCRTGYRSALAVHQLRVAGFTRALNLRGGINEWARKIDPSLPVY